MEQGVDAVGGHLGNHRFDDAHLVFTAHVIAFVEGVTFSREGQRLGAV